MPTKGLDIGLFGMSLDLDTFDDSLLGARVKLHGLTGEQAAHNGHCGIASEFHLLKGIYFVTMDDDASRSKPATRVRVTGQQLARMDDETTDGGSSSDESSCVASDAAGRD